jgi:hypothetical protein
MSTNPTHKEITDYFRLNIYEALSTYTGWKMIFLSKSKRVVSNEMAERYVEIQRYHPDFFTLVERAFLVDFVLFILHSFDKREDSFSLYKVSEKETDDFVKNNDAIISKLKKLRNKVFAHKDIYTNASEYEIPSVIDLDKFFDDLIIFYNKLTSGVDDSSTCFSNAKEIKRHIELLFMNLYRGEAVRKREIDIKWKWEEDGNKASDIL